MSGSELRLDISALDRASKVFVDLAATVEKLERKLADLDRQDVAPEVNVDTEKAERQVGAFATDLERKVSAAVKSLPEIEITADSTEAEREIDQVRRELTELAGKTIGVDLDAGEAVRQADALRERLDRLNREGVDIGIRSNAVAASAELEAISRQVEKLDGKTAHTEVKFDIDQSLGNTVAQFEQLGRIMSTLKAPVALAAAAPQIAALGSAAVTAVGALAVIPAAAVAAELAVNTLKVGFSGFGEAVKAVGDPAKFAAAIKDMAPAAQATAVAFRDLANNGFKQLRLDVQQKLFTGFADQVKQLGGTYLPVLRSSMTGIASSFSSTGTVVARFFQQSSTVQSLREAFTSMGTAVKNVLGAAQPLASVFVDLVNVGAARLPGLTQGIAAAAEKFAAFIATARDSGQLGQWIDQGVNTLKLLGETAGNVGSSLLSVFRAASQQGVTLVQTLAEVTGGVAEFLRSAQGQQTLASVFGTIRGAIDALKPAVAALVPLFAEVVTVAGTSLAAVFQALGPPIQQVASALSSALAPVLPQVGAALTQIGLAMVPVISQAQALTPVFHDVAGAVGAALQAVAPFATAFANTLVSALRLVIPAVEGVAATVRAIAPILEAMAPTLGTLAAGFVAVKAAMTGFNVAQAAISALGGKIESMATSVGNVTTKFTGASAAGEKVAAAGNKISAALPGAALALAALTAETGAMVAGQDKATEALQAGGQAAADYAAGADSFGERLAKNTLAFVTFGAAADVTPSLEKTRAKVAELEAQMTPLQLAQERATRAQNDYAFAVKQFGPNSSQAADAQRQLADATDEVQRQQQAATQATKSYNDQLRDQVSAAQSALGANLQLDDAMSRVVDAEKAANDAAKEHGAKSKEAADANRQLVEAVDAAAQAAQRKAEADAKASGVTDTAAAGASAYASALLSQAATLKGPARDAVLSYLGTLSQAELDALSASAAASGFATEVIKLPDGKTVKVAVDPETGKIVDTKAQLDAIQDKTVGIHADTAGFAQDLGKVQTAFNAVPGTKSVTVTALSDEAQRKLTDLGFTVTKLPDGTIQVSANTDQARAGLDAAVKDANSRVGTITIDGKTDPATGKITQTVKFADGSKGTITVDGNPDPATGKINGSVKFANGSKGTITIDGNQQPANGKIDGTVTYANGKTGAIRVDANTAPATAALNNLVANWNGRQIYVNIGGSRVTGAGGGLVGYAGGGLVSPREEAGLRSRIAAGAFDRSLRRFAQGGVIGGYAPGRDTVPALLSPGEAVLVPELVRQIGPRNILDANYAASHRAPTFWNGGGMARFGAGGVVPDTASPTRSIVDRAMQPRPATAGVNRDSAQLVAAIDRLGERLGKVEHGISYAPTIVNPVAETSSASKASDLRTMALLRTL